MMEKTRLAQSIDMEELERLDYLMNKSRWTLEELDEKSRLLLSFYRAVRPQIGGRGAAE